VADVRVTCIHKVPRNDTHHGITHLGGSNWRWTRQQVVDSINAKTNTFYVFEGNRKVYVYVARSTDGREWVQTYADGVWKDNLLALPECAQFVAPG
jgi:hypothetical protein